MMPTSLARLSSTEGSYRRLACKMKETLIIIAVIVVMMLIATIVGPLIWIGLATLGGLEYTFKFLQDKKYIYALLVTLAYAGFLICLFGNLFKE